MTRRLRDIHRREIGGEDPIDRRLGVPEPAPLTWLLSLLRTRSALGLAPSLTPAIVFLPLGVLLGPAGLDLISVPSLRVLDMAVTIALAVLGVMVGTALGHEIRSAMALLAAASLESAVTIAAVAGSAAYFIAATGTPVGVQTVVFSAALGLCASASSATSADPDVESVAGVATRVADLDDVLPILIAMAFVPLVDVSGRSPWVSVLAPLVVGLVVGAVGWLLFERAESEVERVLFVLGALALSGGAASYLGVSPLAVGLAAGLTWTVAPGQADRLVHDDLRRVQHPVVILLLVTAGALAVPSAASVWLLVPYLLFRVAGKVAGASLAARIVDAGPADLAAYLMSPGVLAIAFALNFRQMLPPQAGEVLLATVAMGTAAFELFALVVVPHWRRRRRT